MGLDPGSRFSLPSKSGLHASDLFGPMAPRGTVHRLWQKAEAHEIADQTCQHGLVFLWVMPMNHIGQSKSHNLAKVKKNVVYSFSLICGILL